MSIDLLIGISCPNPHKTDVSRKLDKNMFNPSVCLSCCDLTMCALDADDRNWFEH